MRTVRKIDSFISSDKDIRNGVPVFKGTRVPVYFVLDHIALGWTPKQLIEIFPTVKQEYISVLLQNIAQSYRKSVNSR